MPVATADLPSRIDLHARVRMQIGKRDFGFDVLAQRRPVAGDPDPALRLVGLALPGTRLFAALQIGEGLVFEGDEGRAMQALAAWTLDALHRGLFIEPPSRRLGDGSIRWERAGEEILERSSGGMRTRVFSKLGAPRDAPQISIDYRGSEASSAAPAFSVRNPRCGYEAVVVVLDGVREGSS